MVCGAELEYLEREASQQCTYCEKEFIGFICCPNGHYVCEDCHNTRALLVTRKICASTGSTDPLEIFEAINRSPGIPMLGCHHAFMVAGAFITAIKNEGTVAISDDMVAEVYERTRRQAIGGYCGLTGVCGIAPALGACFSVILGARCGTDREQKITMSAVLEIVRDIVDLTGPSCCKAYARKSIRTAQRFLARHLQIKLSENVRPMCEDSARHPHGCRKEKCLYFKDAY